MIPKDLIDRLRVKPGERVRLKDHDPGWAQSPELEELGKAAVKKRAKEILAETATRHSAIRDEEASEEVRRASRKYMIFFQHLTPIVWTSVADIGVTLTIRYLTDPRRRRSVENAIWEDVLDAFWAADDINFAYPTVRYYDNAGEGKPGRPPGSHE